MRSNKYLPPQICYLFFIVISLLVLTVIDGVGQPNIKSSHPRMGYEDSLASVRSGNLDPFDEVAAHYREEREQFGKDLLEILKNARLSGISRCGAAFYLGEMRFGGAADALAANIILDIGPQFTDHLTILMGTPAANALIKIGVPSVPYVIRNLAESDDQKIRSESLRVLYRIDDDKDITRFRLQKALSVQPDLTKKARLKSALKALGETTFKIVPIL
jgi:hypothetical protein